jgi:hypothetical protein
MHVLPAVKQGVSPCPWEGACGLLTQHMSPLAQRVIIFAAAPGYTLPQPPAAWCATSSQPLYAAMHTFTTPRKSGTALGAQHCACAHGLASSQGDSVVCMCRTHFDWRYDQKDAALLSHLDQPQTWASISLRPPAGALLQPAVSAREALDDCAAVRAGLEPRFLALARCPRPVPGPERSPCMSADDKTERPYYGEAHLAQRSAYARFLRPDQVTSVLPHQAG